MNSYVDLGTIKAPGALNLTSTEYDSSLLMWANAASRFVDAYTHRFFYCLEATKYFDGASTVLFLAEDVLAITSLSLDVYGNKAYSVSMAATDYERYPLTKLPTTYLKTANNAKYSNFASGIRAGVKIVGVFGYGTGLTQTPYIDSGTTGTVATTTGTTLTLSAAGVQAGHTIRMESEQMYVSSASGLTATVMRGVNGTTAAAHVAAEIYIYQYHDSVVGAAMMQLSIWWERRKSAFASKVGNSTTGEYEIYKGLDPAVKALLDAGSLVRNPM
jgi:hypothetical protein